MKEHLQQLKGFLNKNAKEMAARKIRLGVTGFSRSGKTVFIGALTQALLATDPKRRNLAGPLQQFDAYERGFLRSARIRDDINPTLPQFPFRTVRDAMLSHSNHWPEPTTGIASITLELNLDSQHLAGKLLQDKLGLTDLGFGKLLLEIVDFPGEWLVDLPMLGQDYSQWSAQVLQAAGQGVRAQLAKNYHSQLAGLSAQQGADEALLEQLQQGWTQYLMQAAEHGLTENQPGRHLRPDKLAQSPVLRFAPLPEHLAQSPLYKRCRERFATYQQEVIKPFYRDVFSRMDRQLVLVDVLRTLELGEEAFTDMQQSLAKVLTSFDYGKGGLLSWLTGASTTKVLFAATKADHVTRGDRRNLEDLLRNMLAIVDDNNRLRSSAKDWDVMALASVRATEDRATTQEPIREVLYGQPETETESAHWDPGGLPLDMPPQWDKVRFKFYRFAPLPYPDALQQGFPAINLGRALEFLIGDKNP
ncbi:YcjX family protein [Thiopseudomonas acetoxidans]|uniref:YcjX family protein n=1 Tax=Thiopseudomonas acetoxidans TaxID=3041622 RepID=A0ABT7SPD9_9GAMM|nr:YcjX family protein [Thiopseudomonas sp. CY1220]MDM7858052.1 YcjX family protein [Thiopseudomonas sp. CY1220]